MDQESEKNLLDDYADIFLNTRESKEHKPLKSKYTHNKSRKSSIDLDKSVNKLKASLLYWDKTTLSTLIIRFYTILICQHLLSFLFCVITIKWFKLKEYLKENTLLFIIMFLIAVFLSLSSFLQKKHLRRTPLNYILLSTFSIAYAYVLSYICVNINTKIVLMAIFTTFVITLILIFYVSVALHKYSILGSGASVVFTGMIYYCFISFYTDIKRIMVLISLVWLYLWGFYLIFWTRKLKHKYYKLKGNDYVLVSFKFYVAVLFVISFIYGLKGQEEKFFRSIDLY